MNDPDVDKNNRCTPFLLGEKSLGVMWHLDGAGLVCAIAYGVLAWFSLQPEFLSLWVFYGLLGICLFATLIAFVGVSAREQSLTPLRLLFWAGCFHAIGVLGEPMWEDDFFRYLWDGYRFYEIGSPYGVAPVTLFGDDTIPTLFQGLLARINYPDVPTIYGPTLQYTFLLGHVLAPAEVWILQLLYALADMMLIVLLLRLANIRWVLLYAWSPLVIKELAFTAHPDGLGVLLLMAALFCRQRHSYALAAGLLALSVGAKVFALLLVPFVLWRLPLRYWGVFTLVVAVLYGPFVWLGASDMGGLLVFATEWQFNSSLYAVLLQWLEPLVVKLILGFIFLGVYAWLFWQHSQSVTWKMPRGDIIFGVFLLIAPVVNAWYLIWLLPFAVLFPRLWSWTFSVSVLLSYSIGINLNSGGVEPLLMPRWAIFLEYGAVLVAVCLDTWIRMMGSKQGRSAVGTLGRSSS
jgi:alpha-1,6-mannosyltransferase